MDRLRTKLRTETGTVVGLIPSRKIKTPAARNRATSFNPKTFLARNGHGKTTLRAPRKHLIFSQGDEANAVFYVQMGRVKLTVLSRKGEQEAVVAILDPGDFFGEGCLSGQPAYMATATAIEASMIMRIDKTTMVRVLNSEASFTQLFMAYLLSRNVRTQDDLVVHLFNSVEKRLARVLLILARYGKDGMPEVAIQKISQDTLAEMVGTTRSRVSSFLNKFKKLGFITYNGKMEVHSSLLNIVLHD
ncbi:MAG: Crp/Fnr family transcriptional regulator [Nitrospiraceae bacterium]|nr:Crp/Fnr family transcriptional regulator [Nitrospiraceae bacterium]